MKIPFLAAVIALMTTNATGPSASGHIDLEVTATSITLGQRPLPNDTALDEAIAELAKQTPKPTIYITKITGIPFDRSQHIMATLLASGLKFYLIGHEAPAPN